MQLVLKRESKELGVVFLLYLFLSVLFFWEIIFQQRWFFEDFFTQNYPFRFYSAVEISNLSFPLWNPFVFSGMPFFADIQNAVLYPFNLILSFFVKNNYLPYPIVEFQVIFHFIIGGFFMYLFLKSLDLDFYSSFLGGILFVFTGFFFSHAHHSNMLYSGIWLPAIFFCCNQWFKYKKYWLWICPVLLTISTFGGHPQITLYIFFAFTCYYFFLQCSAQKKASTSKILLDYFFVILLFILLSMVQILPAAEFLQHTNRNVLDFSGAVKESLPVKGLLTFFMPDIFNNTYESWQLWEFRCYMGLGTLLLAMLGMFIRPNATTKFFLFLALLFLILSTGNNTYVYRIFYTLVPGFRFIRAPARFIYLLTFTLSVLAAQGFHFLTEKDNSDIKNIYSLKYKKLFITLSLFILAIPFLSFFIIPSPIEAYKNHFIRYFVNSVSILFATFLCMRYPKKTFLKFLILLLIVLDLFYNRPAYNQVPINLEKMINDSPVARALKPEPEGTRFYVGNKYPAYANMGLIYRMSNLSGYNQFKLKDYSRLELASPGIANILGAKFIDYNTREELAKTWNNELTFYVQNGFFLNKQRLPRAFFVNRSIVDPSFNLQDGIKNPDFDPLKTVYLDIEFPEPQTNNANNLPQYKISHFENKGDKITINIKNNSEGFLVLSEIYYPGWKVFVNGEERKTLKANSLFRAVYLSEKSNKIEFVFKPRSFIIGCYVSSITLLGMILVWIFSSLKDRKSH